MSPPETDSDDSDEDILYQKDAELDALEIDYSNVSTPEGNPTMVEMRTTQGPSLEQKLTDVSGAPRSTLPLSTERPCPLDCGPGGGCIVRNADGRPGCLCPLGRGGERCEKGK